MRKNSIQTKLTIVLIAVSCIGMAAVFVLNYWVMRNNVLEELLKRVHTDVRIEAETIDSWLNEQKIFVQAVADSLQVVEGRERALHMFKTHSAGHPEYLTVFMGLGDDSGIFSENAPDLRNWKATQRGWYQAAMSNNRQPVITAPYLDAFTGGTVITVTRDIGVFDGQKAAFAVDIEISSVIQVVEQVETFGGYAFLVDQEGNIVAHQDQQFNPVGDSKVNISSIPAYARLYSAATGAIAITDYDAVARYIFPCSIPSSGWTLYAAIPNTSVLKVINPDARTIIISVFFLAAAAFIVAWIVRRMVVRPLLAVVRAGERLAEGDLDIGLETKAKDEMGRLIGQFGVIVDNLKMQAQVLEHISDRDFSVSIAPRSAHDSMNIAIQKMVDTINSVLCEIRNSAEQVSISSRQVFDGAQLMASGAKEQSATVEQLSFHIGEFSAKTKINAHTAGRAKQLSESIKEKAERGSKQMGQMTQSVAEINESSRSIGKVIKIIDDIAFQTNILALNAAVEAARAGQHGKGFAVVAEEVRNLAAKSAESAKNTNLLIENSIQKAEMGAAISLETAESLNQIVEGIIQNSELISEIAQISGDQTAAIAQISESIEDVYRVIHQNSTISGQSALASRQMTEQSAILQNLINCFKICGKDRLLP